MTGLASCLLVRCENPEVHYVAHIKLTSRVVPSNVCTPENEAEPGTILEFRRAYRRHA